MAVIGNNADTLLHGLSDFWLRFFRDTKDLQVAYEATAITMGQVYLELLHNVLNTSVEDTPLFRKEYYRMISVREDQVVYKEGLSAGRYTLKTSEYYHRLPQLQNKVFAPTASLDEVEDFEIAGGEIQFHLDPTENINSEGSPGFAYRELDVTSGGTFIASEVADWRALGVQRGDLLTVSTVESRLDALEAGRVWRGAETYQVIYVEADRLSLAREKPVSADPLVDPSNIPPHAPKYTWVLERRQLVGPPRLLPLSDGSEFTGHLFGPGLLKDLREVSFWAVDAAVDTFALYENFGHLFTSRQASTETYRALLRGLMQLYVMGPSIDRVESALNVLTGLPVVRDDGEVLDSYSDGLDQDGIDGALVGGTGLFQSPSATFSPSDVGGYLLIKKGNVAANLGNHQIVKVDNESSAYLRSPPNGFEDDSGLVWELSRTNVKIVKTDRQTYVYPRQVPLRSDVEDVENMGVLTFRAFEPLADAIRVVDYIKDPEWWHYIMIPPEVMPGTSAAARHVTPELYPLVLGAQGRAKIGDPGFYIGANELGCKREDDEDPETPLLRHHANFAFLDHFLKYHLFSVEIVPELPLTNILFTDIQNLLQEVKPAHTLLYLRPLTLFSEQINVAEFLREIKAKTRFRDGFNSPRNQLLIGDGWDIGEMWAFLNEYGGAIALGDTGRFMPLVIGGANPHLDPAPGARALMYERALHAVFRTDEPPEPEPEPTPPVRRFINFGGIYHAFNFEEEDGEASLTNSRSHTLPFPFVPGGPPVPSVDGVVGRARLFDWGNETPPAPDFFSFRRESNDPVFPSHFTSRMAVRFYVGAMDSGSSDTSWLVDIHASDRASPAEQQTIRIGMAGVGAARTMFAEFIGSDDVTYRLTIDDPFELTDVVAVGFSAYTLNATRWARLQVNEKVELVETPFYKAGLNPALTTFAVGGAGGCSYFLDSLRIGSDDVSFPGAVNVDMERLPSHPGDDAEFIAKYEMGEGSATDPIHDQTGFASIPSPWGSASVGPGIFQGARFIQEPLLTELPPSTGRRMEGDFTLGAYLTVMDSAYYDQEILRISHSAGGGILLSVRTRYYPGTPEEFRIEVSYTARSGGTRTIVGAPNLHGPDVPFHVTVRKQQTAPGVVTFQLWLDDQLAGESVGVPDISTQNLDDSTFTLILGRWGPESSYWLESLHLIDGWRDDNWILERASQLVPPGPPPGPAP